MSVVQTSECQIVTLGSLRRKQVTINSDSSQTKADIHITLNFSPVCGYFQLSQLRKWKVIQIFIVLHVFEIHFIKKIHCDSSKKCPWHFCPGHFMLARAPKYVQTEQSFTAWDNFNFILKDNKPNSTLHLLWKRRENPQFSVCCFFWCYRLFISNKVFVFKHTLSISSTIISVWNTKGLLSPHLCSENSDNEKVNPAVHRIKQ